MAEATLQKHDVRMGTAHPDTQKPRRGRRSNTEEVHKDIHKGSQEKLGFNPGSPRVRARLQGS